MKLLFLWGKKIKKVLGVPALYLVLLAAALLTVRLRSQTQVMVAGTWELKIEGLPAPLTWQLEIIQQGERLSLEAKALNGENTAGYGEVKGSSVYFNLNLRLFRPFILEFQGKASWAAMSGKVTLGSLFSGTWKAERQVGKGAYGHNSGQDCFACHANFLLAGTVFRDAAATEPMAGVPVTLTAPDGSQVFLEVSNSAGNFWAHSFSPGKYLLRVGDSQSRTWHAVPAQGSCNRCHLKGGNGFAGRDRLLPSTHTQIPPDNDCRQCHHFPATQDYQRLRTEGVLVATKEQLAEPGSRVELLGKVFAFDPAGQDIVTVRPDIFAPGYFSMFDAILSVASRNGVKIEYHFDPDCQTHFIDRINGVPGNYWYHFSYDAGPGNSTEIKYRRANRWDEALWKPGVWVSVIEGENLEEIKAEYREEVLREKTSGHIIPLVKIEINPSSYKGNPPDSHRITVSREFRNVRVTAHNLRSTSAASPYPKPFQPGVVTSLDILLSLKDQGKLDVVTAVFYTYFAQKYIFSYYVVGMGFPNIGLAHASGRQGFIYLTENGTLNRLPNQADSKLHMTCDIHVIHAPDFSSWRWAELGNPYYESSEPGMAAKLRQSMLEDEEAISRGFNLQEPRVNGDGSLDLSFNLFLPGPIRLKVVDSQGKTCQVILNQRVRDLGIHKIGVEGGKLASGIYIILMEAHGKRQMRHVILSSSDKKVKP